MYLWLGVGLAAWWVAGMFGFYIDWTKYNDLKLSDTILMVFVGVFLGAIALLIGLSSTGRLPKFGNPVLVKAKRERYY
jgi:H+/Cl- antiporter ClcA